MKTRTKKKILVVLVRKPGNETRPLFQLRCCGVDDPSDWARSVYNGYSSHEPREIGIPQNSNTANFFGVSQFKIPQSCCLDQKSPDCLASVTKVKLKKIPTDLVFTQVSELFKVLPLPSLSSSSFSAIFHNLKTFSDG